MVSKKAQIVHKLEGITKKPHMADTSDIKPITDPNDGDVPESGVQDGSSTPKTAARNAAKRAAQVKRQQSTDSKGKLRTVSSGASIGRQRTASLSSNYTGRARRPSLSFSHADSIPFGLDKPSADEVDPDQVPWWTSRRLLLSLTCFIGFFFLYSLRVNLSTAIVCMNKVQDEEGGDNKTYIKFVTNYTTDENGTMINITKPVSVSTTSKPDGVECVLVESAEKLIAEFNWDKKLQGLILGAFFWGYTFMQIPSGYLSDRFGPRITVACGMFPVAILTIISPFLARGSPYLLMVGRVIIGMGEAMMYPGMQSLWARWSPPHERSRLVGFAFGGSQLGNALTFPLASLLCAYGFDGGWPSVFYVTGLACLCWCFVYVFYARSTPSEMASITPIEKKYIEMSLGVYGMSKEEREMKRRQDKPWRAIFTSGPVWAILLANGCGNFGAYMLLTQMPTYMKEVLKFDIKSNGAFSMIPYLVFWVFIIIGGQIADVLISRSILSIEWTRKLCCALGTVVPGIFLVLTGYMDCNHKIEAVVLLSLSMGFCGFQFSSFFINHGDIAPRFAGTVFGFTNTGASVPGIIAPYIVGAITPNKTREEWLVAFYIAAGVYVLGAIIYAILAKGEIQDWAEEHVDDYQPEEEEEEAIPLKGITEDEEEESSEDKKMVDGTENGVKFQ
ncbi:uncharacterized transporter slc-17.2-like isoform X1 [Mya arenaria]|uniref:uncharacterized transporter slc-17.2-like isoform X1 n=2 Tax=Mya arenaria TaxID=6604 RepID=UPI0022E62FB2|nr:uncharacterized transporter slc-17.2-like isoform X1 [Mya arenaria]